ncbi:hypothetical protein [Pseudonocardia endophytica]|uniref:SPW repeat-containing protein n=1 Tax=Pseudonocardia endophytica TaxID=401976 RepID=A0A4R1HRJ6_PSEEN|nr:hypothetical protein [Pseudonocardia endophytica]TCK20002.1 hypothetical protein EV378_3948 [Pseudonocardia endophytica]
MANADATDRARRARSLRITGVIGLLAAVLFFFAAGWIPAVALVVLSAGNLLAAGPVASTGVAPDWARALIIIGGVGFVVSIIVTTIMLMNASP